MKIGILVTKLILLVLVSIHSLFWLIDGQVDTNISGLDFYIGSTLQYKDVKPYKSERHEI
jgi:hypothetical protein